MNDFNLTFGAVDFQTSYCLMLMMLKELSLHYTLDMDIYSYHVPGELPHYTVLLLVSWLE